MKGQSCSQLLLLLLNMVYVNSIIISLFHSELLKSIGYYQHLMTQMVGSRYTNYDFKWCCLSFLQILRISKSKISCYYCITAISSTCYYKTHQILRQILLFHFPGWLVLMLAMVASYHLKQTACNYSLDHFIVHHLILFQKMTFL